MSHPGGIAGQRVLRSRLYGERERKKKRQIRNRKTEKTKTYFKREERNEIMKKNFEESKSTRLEVENTKFLCVPSLKLGFDEDGDSDSDSDSDSD